MDLADRYLNCAAVKLMFRAGQVLRGEACAGLFTKDGNGVNNLYNMQATWYERAAARGHFRRGEYALGLKKIMSVFRHFGDFVEDQYDFHMYCMRKMTLRAYIDMLETEDRIYSHPAFEEAALIAVEALLEVSQRPELRKSPEEIEEAKLAGMSKVGAARAVSEGGQRMYPRGMSRLPGWASAGATRWGGERATTGDARAQAERKEYKRQKAEEEEARRKVAAKGEKTAQASWGPRDKPDTDPTGQRWLHTHEPLEEAAALVDKLRQFCTSSPSTHVAAFDVHMARGKRLLCLAAVRALERCGGAGHPSLPRMVAQLSGAAGATANGGDGGAGEEAVASALRKGLEDVLGGKGVGAWVEEWAREHGGESIEHAMGAAKVRVRPWRGRPIGRRDSRRRGAARRGCDQSSQASNRPRTSTSSRLVSRLLSPRPDRRRA